MEKKKILGYTTGVYDLFHIGHLNLLKNASKLCDHLTVGVTVDELVSYKKKKAVIPFEERLQIIESIKYVSRAIPQNDMDKYNAWQKLKYDILFVGSDWQGHPTWNELEIKLSKHGVKVHYLPYTHHTNSTDLRNFIKAQTAQI